MSTIEQVESPAVQAPVSKPAVTTRDVLHRAADLLEEFGWCQNDYGSQEDGRFCAIGATVKAAKDFGIRGGWMEIEVMFNDAILSAARSDAKYVCEWNDAPERTRAEVVARLRDAAEAS